MSQQDIIRRDHGVILRYNVSDRRALHDERKRQPSDRLRCEVIEAELQLRRLEIIVEHADFSDIALERICQALLTVRGALQSMRATLEMGSDRIHG